MKVVAISDQHGTLPAIPECDLLLIAGDVCGMVSHDTGIQRWWLETEFNDWLAKVPAKQIVGIAGNHDFVAEDDPDLMRSLNWTYLQDEDVAVTNGSGSVELIYGSPWTDIPGWAFSEPEEALAERWAKIPLATTILLVHSPPYGFGDRVNRPRLGEDPNVGSLSLLERVEELRSLKLMVFGHIHEGHGAWLIQGKMLANVALMDAHYRLVHKPEQLEF